MDLSKREGFPATVVHPGHIVAPGYSFIVGPQGNRNTDVIETLREGREVLLPNLGLETIHPSMSQTLRASLTRSSVRAVRRLVRSTMPCRNGR